MSYARVLIDADEAALILSLMPADIRRMVRRNAIPFVVLPCGATRFEPRALIEWVSRLRPQTELA